MEITGKDPLTGKEYKGDLPVDDSFIERMRAANLSSEEINRKIDSLNISADAKSLLHSLANFTVKAGNFILKIGAKILETVWGLIQKYKKASFGLVVGLILGVVVSSIPVIGFMLGALATKLLAAVGFLKGLSEDLKDHELEREAERVTMQQFAFSS